METERSAPRAKHKPATVVRTEEVSPTTLLVMKVRWGYFSIYLFQRTNTEAPYFWDHIEHTVTDILSREDADAKFDELAADARMRGE